MASQPTKGVRADGGPGRVVVSARSYAEAADAIDRLADKAFPVERATIVAHGLRLVEHVRRRSPIAAAAEGAVTGAAIGGMIGLVFGLFTVAEAGLGLGLLVWGMTTGAVVGALVALARHALPRERQFESFRSVESERYDVVVDEPAADEAKRLLAESAVAARRRLR